MLSNEIKQFIAHDVLERFLRYVQVYTTSDPDSAHNPSTERQLTLIRILEQELRALGITDVHVDAHGFLYATLPANSSETKETFGLLAHVDTSPDQPGENVKPRLIQNWNGSPIRFPDDPELVLSQDLSPELKNFHGDTIITASGKTLLGADDKAGVAEIMSAFATFKKFPDLPHPRIAICFTHDEEIGRGTAGIDLERLPKFCYTMDGGEPGELETECFDAWKVVVTFKGIGVHPGSAKNRLVNASTIAARFVNVIPEWQTPEHTEDREGFYYLVRLNGDHERSVAELLLRDFDPTLNQGRIAFIQEAAKLLMQRYPGSQVTVEAKQQYQNMRAVLDDYPDVTARAERAIKKTGLEVIRHPIRGGTDGSLLSAAGHPTPNIFAGGLLFHSRTEWIAHSALTRAVETILYLAEEWHL
jgi:tripeptide aminopeptidase